MLPWQHKHFFDALAPGQVAIDCGANIGEITAQMARPGVIVYAFEPHPQAFARLRSRFAGNPLVHCQQEAVWDRAGQMPLYLHEHDHKNPVRFSTGASLLREKPNITPDTFITVPTIDIAAFIQERKRPVALLKIDVEGVECDIIRHLLKQNLLPHLGVVLVETHDEKIPALRPAVAALRQELTANNITNVFLDWD